jgi:transaldolase
VRPEALLKIFIDTADVAQIREAASMGLVDGVTTNPTLVSRTGKRFEALIQEICEIVDGPVSAETVSRDSEGMMREARHLSGLHPNVVVKIPTTGEGLKAVRRCTAEGIKTNVTLCFSAPQALFVAKAGATYVSPFVGRLDDAGADGMAVVEEIVDIYRNYALETQVLVASIRNPGHVIRAARIGADVATMPWSVMQQLVRHPLTDVGIEQFLKDWEKVPRP